MSAIIPLMLGTVVVSAAITWFVRRFAVRIRLLDRPNARSSHSQPTPRGGGLAIVVSFTMASLVLWHFGIVVPNLVNALLIGGGMVAAIGFVDDRIPLPASMRLIVQIAAVSAGLYLADPAANGVSELSQMLPKPLIYLTFVLSIVWIVNLYNFMDGIDGIAASEAVFVSVAGAALIWIDSSASAAALYPLLFACAVSGFLIWNWPPASIFMGDVGSGFIGFVLSFFAIEAGRHSAAGMHAWLVLGGVFIVDATVTLIRRALRRERLFEAHRTHAYQWVARRWGSHLRVTLSVTAINIVWLLPMAWCCLRYPGRADIIVCIALLPLIVLALLGGAGRAEAVTRCSER